VLFWEGDSGDGCYRVEDGLIKLTMISKSGAERILAFHGPGDIVGVRAIIDRLPRPMSAVAVRDAVLSFVNRTAFEAFAEKHPELCQSLLRLLADRMRERDKMLAATSFLKVKGRIAHTLLELAEHFGEEVAPGGLSSVSRSASTTLPPWSGLHASTWPTPSATGSAASW
jgi:CRP/FNR family transcriptional regulator